MMNTYVRTALFAMVAVTVTFPGTAQATVYQWQDKEGNVHFTDDLTTVPRSYREKVEVKDLPEPSVSVTPVSVELQDAQTKTPPEPDDPYVECQERVEKEKERWTRQLEQDQDRLVELNRMIHRSTASRRKNAYQRERVAVKDRIAKAEQYLRETLPPMESDCETIRYWQGEE
jgi:hypothetical protein